VVPRRIQCDLLDVQSRPRSWRKTGSRTLGATTHRLQNPTCACMTPWEGGLPRRHWRSGADLWRHYRHGHNQSSGPSLNGIALFVRLAVVPPRCSTASTCNILAVGHESDDPDVTNWDVCGGQTLNNNLY